MNDTLLQVKGLKTWLGEGENPVRAVDGVDFEIRRGETFALLGESGCGKSMTALSLMRLLPPSGRIIRGEAFLGETSLFDLAERDMRRERGGRMGMIFQEPMTSLNAVRTIADQIGESVRLHDPENRSDIRSRVIELLKAVGIPDPVRRLDEYPHQLSGGMKQRVAIARALAVKPAVWLMDEPLSALDSQTRELLMDDLVDLWTREPFTACYVTHNLNEAVRLGHRVVVLSRRPGRIRAVVQIDVPLAERKDRVAELTVQQQRLWELLREEAQAADMELVDA